MRKTCVDYIKRNKDHFQEVRTSPGVHSERVQAFCLLHCSPLSCKALKTLA